MPPALTQVQLRELTAILRARRAYLRREVEREVLALDHPVADPALLEVCDLGDEAAGLLDDLQLSDLERRAHELLQVEAALRRIRDGSYGYCIDTGEPIGFERLKAQPTALRTAAAQARVERRHSRPRLIIARRAAASA